MKHEISEIRTNLISACVFTKMDKNDQIQNDVTFQHIFAPATTQGLFQNLYFYCFRSGTLYF